MGKLEVFRDEEFYLIQREGIYHVHGTWSGKRIRRSCGTKNLDKAKLELDNIKMEYLSGWRADGDSDWKVIAALMHRRHRRSAVERNIPFVLSVSDVFAQMQATNFCCAVSGVAFSRHGSKIGWRDPWAPSIDRIENRQGYTLENIRITSLIANTAMNSWGYDALLRMARGVVRSSVFVAPEPVEIDTYFEQANTKNE